MQPFSRTRLAWCATLVTACVAVTVLTMPATAHATPPGYSVYGIDVSFYQGTVDWAAVAASGEQFSIARATLGTSYVDPTFDANYDGPKANGMVAISAMAEPRPISSSIMPGTPRTAGRCRPCWT
jgi:predicted secreted Zn-dependent protease